MESTCVDTCKRSTFFKGTFALEDYWVHVQELCTWVMWLKYLPFVIMWTSFPFFLLLVSHFGIGGALFGAYLNQIWKLGHWTNVLICKFCAWYFHVQQLKTSLLIKEKELTKFRRLAQLMIRQRGEVELFLLDSIQVRAQFWQRLWLIMRLAIRWKVFLLFYFHAGWRFLLSNRCQV